MKKCVYKRNIIKNTIIEIEKAIWDKRITHVGKEIKVTQDISQVWEDYYFILNGVLIRWDDCHKYIQDILKNVEEMIKDLKGESVQLGVPIPLANLLSYRFEDLLVAFPRLNEDPMITEIERYVHADNKTRIRKNCIKRDDVKGLYWELNLLRNRAAHSIKGYYTQHAGIAARYLSISSKLYMIDIDKENKVFRSGLYSYRKNECFPRIVQEYIIDAKYGDDLSKKSLMELLFESSSPKGHGRKKPVLLYPSNIEFFDMNSEFYALSNDMMDYIITQLEVFKSEIDSNKTNL